MSGRRLNPSMRFTSLGVQEAVLWERLRLLGSLFWVKVIGESVPCLDDLRMHAGLEPCFKYERYCMHGDVKVWELMN